MFQRMLVPFPEPSKNPEASGRARANVHERAAAEANSQSDPGCSRDVCIQKPKRAR